MREDAATSLTRIEDALHRAVEGNENRDDEASS